MEETPDAKNELNKNIIELSATVKKINSFRLVFFRGVINGVGTFIGATVVAAIAITLVVQILGFFTIDLGINNYLNSLLSK